MYLFNLTCSAPSIPKIYYQVKYKAVHLLIFVFKSKKNNFNIYISPNSHAKLCRPKWSYNNFLSNIFMDVKYTYASLPVVQKWSSPITAVSIVKSKWWFNYTCILTKYESFLSISLRRVWFTMCNSVIKEKKMAKVF